MYFNIAWQNVKKSYRDFLIYFLTLAFSVCLFYTFNSFQKQSAILDLDIAQKVILEVASLGMHYLSIFVAIIFAFLILYANRFLIRRRKLEFGLYQLLGMPKSKMNRILVYETALIGIISLIAGMMLGIVLSQCLSILTASLFEVTLNYHFIFSWEATLITIGSFLLIFLIIIAFNGFEISRFRLIDLLNAKHKTQKTRIRNLYISVILFFVSILLLGKAYSIAYHGAYYADLNDIKFMFAFGLLGTFIFFYSLSGFLLKFIQTSKRFYYRNLNLFVLKQLNANINSNCFSMAIISILLLLSIGALSTGFSLRDSINATIQQTTPYEASVFLFGSDANEIKIDTTIFENPHFFHVYDGGKIADIGKHCKDEKMRKILTESDVSHANIEIIKLSEFNQFLTDIGEEPISLAPNETFAFSSSDLLKDYLIELKKHHLEIPVYQENQTIKKHIIKDVSPRLYSGWTTTSIETISFGFVVADAHVPKDADIIMSAANLIPKKSTPDRWKQSIDKSLTNYEQQTLNQTDASTNEDVMYLYGNTATRDEVQKNSVGTSAIFTYVGLYLGSVFLIACSVMLALQQLSLASDDRQRFRTLSQLGCSDHMINKALLLQISLYFLIPLALGVIHSFFGIRFVSDFVQLFGKPNILKSSLFTSSILLVVYGSYFYVTYLGYRNIIRSKL